MPEVDLNEGIRMLKENIHFNANSLTVIREQLEIAEEPFQEGVLIDLKMLRLYLLQLISNLKIMNDTQNGQLQILEGIINHINNQNK
jgi:hypothetical protein